jgi:hypothetical protein
MKSVREWRTGSQAALYLSLNRGKSRMKSQDLLFQWLDRRLDPAVAVWLRAQCALLKDGAPERTLHLGFGLALRKSGHAPLAATASEQAEALAVHPGWDLRDWTLDQAARTAMLLSLPRSEKNTRAVLALFQTADLGEHVALIRGLFLLPQAADLLHIGREAIRSNMGDVFFAVTQRNPYAAEHFDTIAWNQMIVKCLFLDLPLRGVYGVDARANADLARMLTGLARERWAAGRALSPEAWRCVAPFANIAGDVSADSAADPDGTIATEAAAVLHDALGKEPADRRGAALALWNTKRDAARALVRGIAPELAARLEAGTLTWENHEHN